MALGTFMFALPFTSQAHDGEYDANKHYYVDKTGYWDDHDQHQKFIKYQGNQGYWDTKGEKRTFITVTVGK
jgi:hypothetical protein